MKIAIACDHESFQLKEALIPYLKSLGHSVRDFGSHSPRPCDYPDYALEAAKAVSSDDCDKGIVLCATGVGASIAANKVTGIRCALANDVDTAKSSRQYQDANMLALGATVVDQTTAFAIVEAWLTTPFSNDDEHQNRIDKIMDSEKQKEKKLTDEINQLKKHRCKNKRTPYRPRYFGILNKAINAVLCIILTLALLFIPLTDFISDLADPRALVNALFESGIFDGVTKDPANAPDTTDPDTTDPDTTDPDTTDPDATVASTKHFGGGYGYTAKLDGEEPLPPSIGGMDTSSPGFASLIESLKDLVDSGLIDEDVLNENLGEGVEIDSGKVLKDLEDSEFVKELVGEFTSSVYESALDPEAESTFTEEKVKEIMNNHIGELTTIVNNNLPEGVQLTEDVVQNAVSASLDAALPNIMDVVSDVTSSATESLREDPMMGYVIKALKFIRSGALRAIVLLIIVALCIVIAVFRLPGLYGLTTIGMSSIFAGMTCGGLHLLFGTSSIITPLLNNLGGVGGAIDLGAIGNVLVPFVDSLANSFYISAIVFSFLGICLVLGTTILRGVFGRLFHAIFAD